MQHPGRFTPITRQCKHGTSRFVEMFWPSYFKTVACYSPLPGPHEALGSHTWGFKQLLVWWVDAKPPIFGEGVKRFSLHTCMQSCHWLPHSADSASYPLLCRPCSSGPRAHAFCVTQLHIFVRSHNFDLDLRLSFAVHIFVLSLIAPFLFGYCFSCFVPSAVCYTTEVPQCTHPRHEIAFAFEKSQLFKVRTALQNRRDNQS